MKIYRNLFNKIVQPERLFLAWNEFKINKGKKVDVLSFEQDLEQNIFALSRELETKTYIHGGYTGFYISDPKVRHIHKATVRDRVLHHALTHVLTPVFEPTFISNSFSCRIGKGSHRGVEALQRMLRKESQNNTKSCFVLKCDVRKFFDSINHTILYSILRKRLKDEHALWLLERIIGSYQSERSDLCTCRGVPIGNLTSQLFANVYMNEFDQFIKHTLKIRNYARYTDDFVIVAKDKEYLESLILPINEYLENKLDLQLHPNKVEIHRYTRGVDFLGYVNFPYHTLIRKRTEKRLVRKLNHRMRQYQSGTIEKKVLEATLASYLGVLSHANAHQFSENLKNYFWFMINN